MMHSAFEISAAVISKADSLKDKPVATAEHGVRRSGTSSTLTYGSMHTFIGLLVYIRTETEILMSVDTVDFLNL